MVIQEIKDRISLIQTQISKAKRDNNKETHNNLIKAGHTLECAVFNLLGIIYSIRHDVDLESHQTIDFMQNHVKNDVEKLLNNRKVISQK